MTNFEKWKENLKPEDVANKLDTFSIFCELDENSTICCFCPVPVKYCPFKGIYAGRDLCLYNYLAWANAPVEEAHNDQL